MLCLSISPIGLIRLISPIYPIGLISPIRPIRLIRLSPPLRKKSMQLPFRQPHGFYFLNSTCLERQALNYYLFQLSLADDNLANLATLTTDVETGLGIVYTDTLKVEVFDRGILVGTDFINGAAGSLFNLDRLHLNIAVKATDDGLDVISLALEVGGKSYVAVELVVTCKFSLTLLEGDIAVINGCKSYAVDFNIVKHISRSDFSKSDDSRSYFIMSESSFETFSFGNLRITSIYTVNALESAGNAVA